MKNSTRALLVLLRLTIGWHFLVEGYEKIESVHRGPTELSKPWSSEGYLREATGPLSGYFRGIVGDQDEITLGKLMPADPKAQPPRNRIGQDLAAEWQAYFDGFVAHHGLIGAVKEKAQADFDAARDRLGEWLVEGTKEVDKAFPSGSVKVTQTTTQRVRDYRAKLGQLRDALEREMPAFEQDVLKAKVAALKADVRRQRTELLNDLTEKKAELGTKLKEALNEDQKKQPAFVETPAKNKQLQLVDQVTMYGLTIVGALLLLGLFTRPACVGGAALLLLFYLAMPALPGVPDNPRAEGHYLFINKNIIEMVALLALATTSSGTWLGLDGLVQFLNPWRRKPEAATT